MRFRILFILTFVLAGTNLNAQDSTSLLIIANKNARVVVDGQEIGTILKSKPEIFKVTSGEHYLQVFCQCLEQLEYNEVLNLEPSKQKVLKVEFESAISTNAVSKKIVAQFDFSIPGIMAGASSDSPIEYPTFYYAFEAGDKVELNLDMSNEKGTNSLGVVSYPDGRTVFSKDNFQDLNNLTFPIQTRGIYGFLFTTNHAFARDVSLVISRIPASQATSNFKTDVILKDIYETKTVHQPQSFQINGGSKATFDPEGKSRIYLPIELPENTVKWYYEFTASRNDEDNNNIANMLNLGVQLTSVLLDQTGTLNSVTSHLTQPPGSDYCDIYLIDQNNLQPFISKQGFSHYPIGTRENFKSGIVEIDFLPDFPIYLGIKNPSTFYGIDVAIEVVAIVKSQELVMLNED